MRVFVDTNVALRLTQPTHPHHAASLEALEAARRRGDELTIAPQVLYEFWVVSTRPTDQRGLGLSTEDADAELAKALAVFTLLPDTAEIFEQWRRLVVGLNVKGKTAHDARLVASMIVHGVGSILTFNGSDFARYPDIAVLHPADYASDAANP